MAEIISNRVLIDVDGRLSNVAVYEFDRREYELLDCLFGSEPPEGSMLWEIEPKNIEIIKIPIGIDPKSLLEEALVSLSRENQAPINIFRPQE